MTKPGDDGSAGDEPAPVEGRADSALTRPDDVGRVLRRGVKSALARWLLAKRGGAGRPSLALVAPPTPQDEATHAWDGQRHFAEDYTFVGTQPGLGVIVRLEQLPGRDSQRVWVVVLRPSGVWALHGGQLVLRTTGDDRWRAGGLSLDCETPLHRWAVRFAGALERSGHGGEAPALRVVGHNDHSVRASVDLTFVATARPYVPGTDDDPELLARCLGQASWDARLLQAVRRDRPRGYVQLGELHGTIALGDVLVPVRAAALRQHHWGVRDWGACDDAYQCFWANDHDGPGGTGPGRGWIQHARFPFVTLDGGFTAVAGASSATSRGALLAGSPGGPQAGRVEPVRRISATFEARPRRAPARASLAVGEADGTRHVQLELVSDLSFPVDGRGRVDLALVRTTGSTPTPTTGWGLWAGLHRTLPRR
jgi:hypothetical protein